MTRQVKPPAHVSQHAYEAAQVLLQALRARGKQAENIDEAIQKGYLTDLDWCRALQEYRELYGVVSITYADPVAAQESRSRAKRKGAA
ncbi:hypothetical protein [Deinococcus hopiensis]|uniref:Uncharacterized protein n=1 Tax=Deinococcus hopiensis KR-140 TaxID=695939 RepID=A0A1W1VJ90_9DEIO|nr:hypothetical protein [Deinococcus hopiensis]SMB93343.1 hypothetical protein SAMN00790413_01945 [Deinococcus hopiensis KR-140]